MLAQQERGKAGPDSSGDGGLHKGRTLADLVHEHGQQRVETAESPPRGFILVRLDVLFGSIATQIECEMC